MSLILNRIILLGTAALLGSLYGHIIPAEQVAAAQGGLCTDLSCRPLLTFLKQRTLWAVMLWSSHI